MAPTLFTVTSHVPIVPSRAVSLACAATQHMYSDKYSPRAMIDYKEYVAGRYALLLEIASDIHSHARKSITTI